MRTSLDVQQFIDTLPFSRLQRTILWLCFFVVAVDGFDTAAIGFIAPAICQEWHLSAAALAPLALWRPGLAASLVPPRRAQRGHGRSP